MIVLSWNIRGLGARIKRSSLRKLISSKNPAFVFIQETKMENIEKKVIRTCWRADNLLWASSPSRGNSGGLLSIWSPDFFKVESHRIDQNWIALCGCIISKDFRCILINIYNPCSVELRKKIWCDIEEYRYSLDLPCLIMGDFNEILHLDDRGSQWASHAGMDDFKSFIQNNQFLDLPPSNGKYTWMRGNSKSCIDRLVINPEWLSQFPTLKTTLLKRSISDHFPLLATSSDKNWGPKPFRFLNCWLSHPKCLKVIEKSWTSSKNLSLPDKLRAVKSSLKKWNEFEFGIIDSNISNVEHKIHLLDSIANDRNLSSQELMDRNAAQADLRDWLKRKESLWAQKSRVSWLKEGDRNTRFFHAMASVRLRKNSIESILHKGASVESPNEIKRAAMEYYKEIFSEECSNRPTFSSLNFKKITQTEASMLITPISDLEIENAVSSCASDKAPGPDGFNFHFIKNSWDIMKDDIFRMVKEFWATARLPKGSNIAFIALIPKNESPEGFKDFRPISMVGCLYKIIAKILASRLQSVMNSIINPFQSSFVCGRQILDGAMVAAELIESCKRHNSEAILLKLDFHKAFDNVSWNFLEWALTQMGFPRQWINWILACVTSASASVLINGSPSPPIKLQRGLRQGDPLSPFLFDIVVEVLHLVIERAISLNCWEGIEVCPGGKKISHLQYADDTLVFCPPNLDFLLNIKKSLI